MTRHLCIPDPHAHPDHHNKRFGWLANLIIDTRPDHVICMGDMADMPSMSSYDRGTKGYEGRRYKKDLWCVHDALNRIREPLVKRKKKLPKFWMLEGNHEKRITNATNNDAMLDGTIGFEDLLYKDYGWETVRYNGGTPGVLTLDGIAYAHYFTSGIMGRPISGINPAAALLGKQFQSCTQGHTHTTDYAVRTNASGSYIQGLVAGCYLDYYAEWAGEANRLWWSGVVMKENVNKGVYDPRFISMHSIKKEYKK